MLSLSAVLFAACGNDRFVGTGKFFAVSCYHIGEGEVTAEKYAEPGDTVTVVLTPSVGYKVGTVTLDGELQTVTGNTFTFTMPKKAVVVYVVFIQDSGTGNNPGGGDNPGGGEEPDDPDPIIKPSTKSLIKFWVHSDEKELKVYEKVADDFNATVGETLKVEVKVIPRSSDSYNDVLHQSLAQSIAPDLFVLDYNYKLYAEEGYLADLTSYVAESTIYDTDGMWDNAVSRYKYDVDTGREGRGKLYAAPIGVQPTVLFYNETYFAGAGIKILSVAPGDLDAFNAGARDERGNTKAALGLDGVTVKQKGYFVVNGQKYFNNKVPMSWGETIECANAVQSYMRGTLNNRNAYGYFTEWWFNYCWSVGGNSIQEIPSALYKNGYYYDFTLMDDTKNYIVADGVTDGVTVNGHRYNAGEIIAYRDKLDMSIYSGKRAMDGKNMYRDRSNYKISDEVTNLKNAGKLNELPSQREALAEFVRIGDIKNGGSPVEIDGARAYGVAPLPAGISGVDKAIMFMNGFLGMLVDGYWSVGQFRNDGFFDFAWDVAPLPLYKQYDANGDITVHGVEAGHSETPAIAISKTSKVPAAAWKFIEYCASADAQSQFAQSGCFIPMNKTLARSELVKSDAPANVSVFLDAAEYEKAGDWWFLTDSQWIDEWAGNLHGAVRNGKMTFQKFFESSEYANTFGRLERYCEHL